MSVHRIMGVETEYGISAPGDPGANPVLMSSQVVNAYGLAVMPDRPRRLRWDYDVETPLRDARGFDMSRAEADPSQLTDDDYGLANLVLFNGARFYVDHAHPEYSSPEVTNPRDAALWDVAGDRIMERSAALASELSGQLLTGYKNNSDGKGVSYGTHENYQVSRATPFRDLVRHLTPFFVTRCVYAGAGRVGIGQEGRVHGFQISQRADFFEAEVGLETTLRRPIINTRDEPHADPEHFRRLHVIVGDANMSHRATYLKFGTTALVLSMIEDGALDLELDLHDPVAAMHQVSHDVDFRTVLALRDGRTISALDIQRAYLEAAHAYLAQRGADDMTADVVAHWTRQVEALGTDPMSLVAEVDWIAKRAIIEGYRARDHAQWDDPRLAAVDLQYADLRADKGLARVLAHRGRMVTMFDEESVRAAVDNPPADTRAYFRGTCMRQYTDQVAAASWDSVIFDFGPDSSLRRITTGDARKGTKALTEALFRAHPDALGLVQTIEQAIG